MTKLRGTNDKAQVTAALRHLGTCLFRDQGLRSHKSLWHCGTAAQVHDMTSARDNLSHEPQAQLFQA